MIPSHPYPLSAMPRLVQCGLCVHGTRSVETFRQRGLWSFHVYHYAGEMVFRGATYRFAPGSVSLIPPEEEVKWRFPQHAPHYYAHFRVAEKARGLVLLPLLRDSDPEDKAFGVPVDEMIAFFPASRRRAEVRLWDLLHTYAGMQEKHEEAHPLHPGVQIALSIIRNTPSGRLKVGGIAKQMGISHNQLTNLFNKHFGCGVSQFIRRERVGRAVELLQHSTLPIKSIAIECGFPDLQYFNKVIRGERGGSPTELRRTRKGRRIAG